MAPNELLWMMLAAREEQAERETVDDYDPNDKEDCDG